MTIDPTLMSDDERERHIKDCGLLMLKAHAEGDFAARDRWLAMQNEAIRNRSPEMVARLEDCYFAGEGDKARRAAQRRSINA